jgi:hypothetical protein
VVRDGPESQRHRNGNAQRLPSAYIHFHRTHRFFNSIVPADIILSRPCVRVTLRIQKAGTANSDKAISESSVFPQPKTAEKRRSDVQTTMEEPPLCRLYFFRLQVAEPVYIDQPVLNFIHGSN